MEFEDKDNKVYGTLKKSDKKSVVVRVCKFMDKWGIDIREFYDYSETGKFKGFSQKGIRIPIECLDDLKKLLNMINVSDLK
jgi:hypothetical protein